MSARHRQVKKRIAMLERDIDERTKLADAALRIANDLAQSVGWTELRRLALRYREDLLGDNACDENALNDERKKLEAMPAKLSLTQSKDVQ